MRVDTASVTRLDNEVELTFYIASFIRIDAVSVTRLDDNVESIVLVSLDDKVNIKVLYM